MILSYDAKRAFSTKWLYLSMAVMILLAAFTRLDAIAEIIRKGESLEQGWTMNFIMETLTGDAMLFCLPVLCTLPFSASFIDEYKAGILRFSLSRVKRRTWIISKAVTAALSGGCMLTAGALGVLAACSIIFLRLEAPVGAGESVEPMVGPMLQLVIRYFCFGALGAVLGLYISAAVANRFMAWLAPFMAEYLLIIFYERYFPWCQLLYPKEWLKPSEQWPGQGWSVCLWLAALTVFVSWLFARLAERRLANV